MLPFSKLYQPLTSHPFQSDAAYREFLPANFLRQYVACYWTMEDTGESKKGKVLVIPDTCMDVIVHINHTRQVISGGLCGMQDQPFFSKGKEKGDRITSFAIRFHFWSACLFMKLDFHTACNRYVELRELGSGWQQLFDSFFYITDIGERISRTEQFLLNQLYRSESNPNLYNAIHHILASHGRDSVSDIREGVCISQRQLERLFLQDIGLPMKRMAKLVRYQNVWREMLLSPKEPVQDLVYRYGYTDQSHLLKDFKHFHGVTPAEAVKIAYISL